MRWNSDPEDNRTNLVLAPGLQRFLQEHRTEVIIYTALFGGFALMWVIFVDFGRRY